MHFESILYIFIQYVSKAFKRYLKSIVDQYFQNIYNPVMAKSISPTFAIFLPYFGSKYYTAHPV